ILMSILTICQVKICRINQKNRNASISKAMIKTLEMTVVTLTVY
uniref:Lysine vasopressin receptor (Fragments) n=1 Tax=Macropus giganteus TaxID=9317 RepID=Q9TSC9_MACGI